MALYRFQVQKISGYFDGCEFHHIPRTENDAADTLSKLGSTRQSIPPGIALEHLRKPSIAPSPESESIFIPAKSKEDSMPMEIDKEFNPEFPKINPAITRMDMEKPEVVMSAENMEIDSGIILEKIMPTWVQPIFSFLKDATLPSNEVLDRQTMRRAKAYTI